MMTEKQLRIALSRAVESEPTREELDRIVEAVQEYEAVSDGAEPLGEASLLLAGFCLGYAAGREDESARTSHRGREAVQPPPEARRNGTAPRPMRDTFVTPLP